MRREFWEGLNEGFVKIGSVGLQRYKRAGWHLRQGRETSIAAIFPFINWFSVAARSSLSFVSNIGFLALSMSKRTCIGIIV